MCGWGMLEAGVLWVVWTAGLVEMEVEPPPQSESSMLPPLLHPAPQPFCSLHRPVIHYDNKTWDFSNAQRRFT